MHEFRRILVGVDLSFQGKSLSGVLSPPTEEAVERGMLLAAQNGAELCFAAVLDAGDTTERLIHDARTDDPNVFDEAHALLGQLVQKARQRQINAEARVLVGKSWLKLIQEVLKFNHDLVVVGTRHEGFVDRVLFGSTAIKLLRKCPCPVWVAKPSGGKPLSSVLVAHDLGAVGRYALDMGLGLALSEDLQLYVIHGLEQLPVGDVTGLGFASPDVKVLHQEAHDRILVELEGVELSHPPQIRIINGRPESAILEMVEENSIDLLIMGTLGRTGLRGVLTGNTAERILARLQCSLLAVKPDEFHCPIELE
ncbi:MAG TPA: universal stress protein [Planctomycetaceae bacterium]|nr:universal stress protein [Planctomycetaceae bacterium]HQZ68718.1 universal stress protein [Planctomycetaceae bacterium]HRA89392.1 universal stress protein [Planctomycetaceae bacterium]